MNVPIIILAAGSSSRMGRAKQLLPYKGKSLLRHAIDTALESSCSQVAVVLGSRKKAIEDEIMDLPIKITENSEWSKGMGGSIRTGMKCLPLDAEGVILMLCDQPKVTPTLLNELIALHEYSRKPIIASAYGGSLGVPAFFASSFFPQLSSLTDQIGAKKVILTHQDQVHPLSFPLGTLDIDTPEDFQNLT